jgi:hypothetical protein
MATKEQNGPSEVKETQRNTVEHRSSQPASRAVALAGPRSPSLPAIRHGGYLWSNVECTVECKNISAFERMAYVQTQAHDLSAHLVL